MADHRPIGIFDSGVGGLTALRVLRARLPGERLVYLGDTARVPYGGRSVAELRGIAESNTRFLLGRGVKAVLVACGTVSANCLEVVERLAAPLPVLGVIEAAARRAAAVSRGRVGVLATVASARSGAFPRALAALAPGLEVLSAGTPDLVPLAEAGRTAPEDPAVQAALAACLAPMRAARVDTLVLGCTHFPLLAAAIAAYMGPEVALVDSGAEAAAALAARLEAGDLGAAGEDGGADFFVSGDPGAFARTAALFLDGGAPEGVRRAAL